MKKTQRIMALILGLMIVLMLPACSGKDSQEGAVGESAEGGSTAGEVSLEDIDAIIGNMTLRDKAEQMIHDKSDMTVSMAVEGAGTASRPTSVNPCIMYLTTDGRNSNTLYDVYRVTYPEKDGSDAERYVVIYYNNIVIRNTEQPTMSYDRTMYTGQVIEALDKGYGGYMTGYKSIKDVKTDILTHQSKAVTLQERESKQETNN